MIEFNIKQSLPQGGAVPDLEELSDILRDEMKLINAPGQGEPMVEFTGPLTFKVDGRIPRNLIDDAVTRSVDRYMKRTVSKAIEQSAHDSKPVTA